MRGFFVALDDHRNYRLANDSLADLAVSFLETIQRDDCFGHGAMTAGAADVVIELLHDITGAFDVADVAHRDDHAVLDQRRYHSPLHPFDMETKFRHLRNDVLAIDFTHVDHSDSVVQLQTAQSATESF